MDLEKRFRTLEEAYKAYKAKPGFENISRLNDRLEEMSEDVYDLMDEEERKGE